MNHKIQTHDNTNYKKLSYALRNDMSVASERINHAYQLLLERKASGYPVSPTVIWYCEQALIDLDRPDLVTTCFGESLPETETNPCDAHFPGGWYITKDGQRLMAVPPHMGVDAENACPKCRGWLSYPKNFAKWDGESC